MKSNYICSILLAAGSSVVYADNPTPIDAAYLGVDRTIQVNGQVGYQTQGGGGQFSGTLAAPGLLAVPTSFWCVDDQEAFYWGESKQANVTLLSAIGINNPQVRYGQVSNVSSPHWTNTDLLPDTAAARYEFAAYLVSQYVGFDVNNPTISNASMAIQNENDAIQKAIWSITNTTTTGSSIYEAGYSDINGTTGSDPVDSVSYWVNQAKLNYATITPSNWGVVSWGAQADGTLNYGSYNADASANQTFLVELTGVSTNQALTPEPGFYGALTVGFGGLVFAIRRRNKA